MSQKSPPEVLLVVPPAVPEPLVPFLGVAQLSAVLKRDGIEVATVDLNLEFATRWVLSDECLQELETRLASIETTTNITLSIETKRKLQRHLHEGTDQTRKAALSDAHLLNEIYSYYLGWGRDPIDLSSTDSFASQVQEHCGDWDKPLLQILSGQRLLPPKLLGVSILFSEQLLPAFSLIRGMKRDHPGVRVVVGGGWCTAASDLLPDVIKRFPEIDAFVTYEGEGIIKEIYKRCAEGKSLAGIPGVCTLEDGVVSFSPPDVAPPLESLPAPDFDSMALEHYLTGELPILTRRECYWKRCIFCARIHLDREKSTLDPDGVVRLMDTLNEKYGSKRFLLLDLTVPKDTLLGIAEKITSLGRDYQWRAMARFDKVITKRQAAAIKAGGCQLLLFGLEVVHDDEFRLLDKGTKMSVVEQTMEALEQAGLNVSIFTLVYPTQSVEQFEDVYRFVLKHHKAIAIVTFNLLELSRCSRLFKEPSLLNIRIDPRTKDTLDVYRIPYESDSLLPLQVVTTIQETYMRRFALLKGGSEEDKYKYSRNPLDVLE